VNLAIWIIVLAVAGCQAQPADRDNRWRDDLRYFETEFRNRHADFHKLYPEPAFKAEIERINADIPKLSDAEITLRLMRLVATANVGHTYVALPGGKFGFLPMPLSMHWFSDGLAVTGASLKYQSALGAHVLRIGSMTPDQLLAAVAPYIAHENETWLRQQSTGYMGMLPVLRRVGAMGEQDQVAFTLAKPGGEPFTLDVEPDPASSPVGMYDVLPIPPALSGKRPASYYWYEYLPDSRALYVQYNRCKNDPKLAFADFAQELFTFADAHAVERVIVDVRFNGGGNSAVIDPLKNGLKKRRWPVYVLIGAGTFSSGQLNAIELRRELHARLVGEPTGEKPNGYGEVRPLTLPNSQLRMQYSTKFFRLSKGDPAALEPDINTPRTLEDALAGRDPALDAALRQH
jgi:hypothetical protein